ncbi:MAG: M20/M25/M40 family metallo-hydrolase [Bacteroidota bacterium]
MKRFLSLLVFAAISPAIQNSYAQEAKDLGLEAITESAVKGQLEFLASDWTEGRHTGRPGAYMAADYIASIFKIYGLEPGGATEYIYPSMAERMQGKRPVEYHSYYQSFDLIEYKAGEDQLLSLVDNSAAGSRTIHFAYRTDFSVRTSDVAIDLEMPLVFVGYGYTDEKAGYDDFKDMDVKGKVILCLSGYPGHSDTDSKAYKLIGNKSRWSLWREKNKIASDLGVAAVIEVKPGSGVTKNWADNLPFRYNSGNYEGDKPRSSFYDTRMILPGDKISGDPTRITVSDRVLHALLEGSDIDIEKFEEEVKNSLKPDSRALQGKTLKIKTSVESKITRARNVVGVLPGKDSSEIIVIGGHYDHLGKHDGWIWNGADDNASGTVGVMTIAKACMATGQKPEKTIVFAAWTGEEKGLLGSEYFADHPYNDAHMILNLNYDMISRDNKDDTLGVKCSMTYTRKYEVLEKLTRQNNEDYELGLDVKFKPSDRPRGGSDHSSFSRKDVPVMYFMAGFPPEYHQPDDHLSLVNWDKMVRIIKMGYLNIWDLANMEWGPAEKE